ncbi:MAG: hypothetical protein ABIX10_08055 [Acidimicrobiales bacterium]
MADPTVVVPVPEIRSLGKTWRTEILAHHDTGASNGWASHLSVEASV